MNDRSTILSNKLRFIGMVHLLPLPGSPRYGGEFQRVLDAALTDAATLEAGGVDAIMMENWGDAPFYPGRVEPETVAAMARILGALSSHVRVPLGVNCLRNDARSAVGLCATGEASFFRVNVHTGATVTDQGLIEGRAFETMRERQRLAPDALLFADVHVKHGRPLVERSLEDEAKDIVLRGGANALILSGEATGYAPSTREFEQVQSVLPETALYVGSGLTVDTAPTLLAVAHGAIVGTALKAGGDVDAPVELARVRALRALFDSSH